MFDLTIEKEKIDLNTEDQEILTYQQTEDQELIRKIYTRRIDTLKFWTFKTYSEFDWGKHNGWTTDDLYQEFTLVFLRTVKHFKPNKKHWNTLFFTSAKNHIKNLKELSFSYDKNKLADGTISLDYIYHSKDATCSNNKSDLDTLHNLIDMSYQDTSYTSYHGRIDCNEWIDKMCDHDIILREILVKLSEGYTVRKLSQTYPPSVIKKFKRIMWGAKHTPHKYHKELLKDAR